MTKNEAIGFILGKLNCMERCDRFDCKNTDECDNCEYCYSQGNFGQQKEAFSVAINALEKQIAKKPFYTFSEDEEILASCEICDSNIDWTYQGHWRKGKPNYCKNCGQAIDWSL